MYPTAAAAIVGAWTNVPRETTSPVAIAIVKDQITANSEDPGAPFFYCPEAAVKTLHRFGKVVEVITVKPAQ